MNRKRQLAVTKEVKKYCKRNQIEFTPQLARKVRRKFQALRQSIGLPQATTMLKEINTVDPDTN